MPLQKKLGRATNQRKAILKNLVTALFEHGKLETTEARAIEVKKIAEHLIAIAVKESGNFTSKQDKVSRTRLDSGKKKITKTVDSKNDKRFEVMDREDKTEMRTVDSSSRLSARREIIKWLNRPTTKDGDTINLANRLFDEIAPRYKTRNGGYLRIYKLGTRRGDGAEVAILEFV